MTKARTQTQSIKHTKHEVTAPPYMSSLTEKESFKTRLGSAWLEASHTQGLCVFLLGQTEI